MAFLTNAKTHLILNHIHRAWLRRHAPEIQCKNYFSFYSSVILITFLFVQHVEQSCEKSEDDTSQIKDAIEVIGGILKWS